MLAAFRRFPVTTYRNQLRSFCAMSESKFESLANTELETIADLVDSQICDNDDVDGSVELHEGVLTIDFLAPAKGTFVVNKHTASRQIWYSSPVSQPAYFDADSGWYSKRLGMVLRSKLALDVEKLVRIRLEL